MKIAVWDTYVSKENGLIMHFDILVEENKEAKVVLSFGKEYLSFKGLKNKKLTIEECRFCHIEIAPEHIEKGIKERGYFIIEMENC